MINPTAPHAVYENPCTYRDRSYLNMCENCIAIVEFSQYS